MSDNADDNQGRATRRVKASMMDDIESYVQRGRRYQGLSDAKLLEMCVAALLRFERAPHEINPGLLKDRLDIACEMQLRGIEPPAELLECAFSSFVDHVLKLFSTFDETPELQREKILELLMKRDDSPRIN